MSAINIPATMLDGRETRQGRGEEKWSVRSLRSVVIFLFPVLVRKEGRSICDNKRQDKATARSTVDRWGVAVRTEEKQVSAARPCGI